jgi:hypothetical protein
VLSEQFLSSIFVTFSLVVAFRLVFANSLFWFPISLYNLERSSFLVWRIVNYIIWVEFCMNGY